MAVKRKTVGSILKSKENGQTDYIKISENVTLTKGDVLILESASTLRQSADYLEANKKISADVAEKMRERADKFPSFVRFNIVQKLTE